MARPHIVILAFAATAIPARAAAQVDPPPPPPPIPAVEEAKPRKSFLLPILEIVVMDAGINLVNRQGPDGHFYKVTGSSIRRNLRSKWVIDDDPFDVNQFLHPYQGAMYHGIARSAGLNYWQSVGYTFAGSALWEIAGEVTKPSKNDQIASGIAGSFFGEPLFRLSEALIHGMHGTRKSSGFWRFVAATIVSPPNGINHKIFGDRYEASGTSNEGATDLRLQLGATGLVKTTARDKAPRKLNSGIFGVAVDYGLPGRAEYAHERPFDYFSMEATVSGARGAENVATRGLITGKDYYSEKVAGVWGLYGHYDYLANDAFRFSTTAVSLGTSTQFWLSEHAALQTTVLAGVGYYGGQTVRGTDETDVHYGIAPQGLVTAKLIGGRRLSVEVSGREYYATDVGGFRTEIKGLSRGGHDRVRRGDVSLALRLFGRHAISVTYRTARRTSFVTGFPSVKQRSDTVGVLYNLLGSGGFGAIR
jgi:hypothetical protein